MEQNQEINELEVEETEEEEMQMCPCCNRLQPANDDWYEVRLPHEQYEMWCEHCYTDRTIYSSYYDAEIDSNEDYSYFENRNGDYIIYDDDISEDSDVFINSRNEVLLRPWSDADYVAVYNRYNTDIQDYLRYDNDDIVLCRDTDHYHFISEVYYTNGDYYCEEPTSIIEDYHDHKGDFDVLCADSAEHQLGFELEIETARDSDYTNEEIAEYIKEELGEMFVFENDASLDYGFECITQIISLKYLEDVMPQFTQVCKKLVHMGCRSHNVSTCGLHIHINRAAFGETLQERNETIEKVVFLLENFKKQVCRFARRGTNTYNLFRTRNDFQQLPQEIKLERVKSSTYGSSNRYYNVNLLNTSTVEFRMFRGTLKATTILYSVVFALNIVALARRTSESELNAVEFEDILKENSQYAAQMLEYYDLCRERV